MKFDKILENCIAEGAIRVFRLSDNLAFAYRFQEGHFEARGLYGKDGQWSLGNRLVSTIDYSDQSGWHRIAYLPRQAEAIDDPKAEQNPGYGIALFQQCYTCKEQKSPAQFSLQQRVAGVSRELECDDCYRRRTSELAQFEKRGEDRSGDLVSKKTHSAPPPPASKI